MAPRSRLTSQTEQLIAEVKKHPCLYQIDRAEYRDPVLKNKCWKEISKKLNRDTSLLRKDWKNLRDCYRQALITRQSTKKRQTKLKPWKFEKQMLFVKPYLGPKSCSADTSETSRALGAASAPISDDGAIDADDGAIDADDGAVDADDSAIDADNDAIDADDDEKEFKSFNTASTTADEYTTVNVSAASSNFPDPITLLTKTEPGEQIIIPINGVNHVVERFHSIVEPPTSVMGDPIITLLPPSFMRPRRRVAPPVLRINREVQTDEPSLNPRQQDNPPFSGRAQPMRPPLSSAPNQQPFGFRNSRCNRSTQWDAPDASDLELFFISMFQSTRKMARCYQSRVKREVLNTILRVEDEYERRVDVSPINDVLRSEIRNIPTPSYY
ncbi:MADF domain-containing protein [Trichonephila clavata]|uniref:MADF domain-containing protein n=1 Tax=Trichonephila clavata TaxID=2740835 RepID=A0A8X6LCT0_TRICU|nr:MADF domain-containing protein [Trichonephila clavata]